MTTLLKTMRSIQAIIKAFFSVLPYFWNYINSLTKKIFRSLVNVDTDDTSVYGYTSKNLSSHLAVTYMWGKTESYDLIPENQSSNIS